MIFLRLFFHSFTPYVRLFFRQPKVFGFKNVTKRRIRKILTFVLRFIVFKIFGIIKLKPL